MRRKREKKNPLGATKRCLLQSIDGNAVSGLQPFNRRRCIRDSCVQSFEPVQCGGFPISVTYSPGISNKVFPRPLEERKKPGNIRRIFFEKIEVRLAKLLTGFLTGKDPLKFRELGLQRREILSFIGVKPVSNSA